MLPDEQKVAEMLSGLTRVGAPADFDLRLKGRIATSRPVRHAGWLFPALKLAVPAAGLVLLAGSLYFSGYLSADVTRLPVAAVEQGQPEPARDQGRAFSDDERDPVNKEPETASVGSREPEKNMSADPIRGTPRMNRAAERPLGGSVDRTARADNTVLTPMTGREARTSRDIPPDVGGPGAFGIREILELVGIKAVFQDQAWNVVSADPEGAAGLAGVRAGDRIEAIDERPLGETTVLPGRTTIRSLSVRRGEERIRIDLKR